MLQKSDKCCPLSNFGICYTRNKYKRVAKGNEFQLPGQTWDKAFELPDGSCSISAIPYSFEYIVKKEYFLTTHLGKTISMNLNIESRLKKVRIILWTFIIQKDFLISKRNERTKNKNNEKAPQLDLTEVVLVHWRIAYNNYQDDSKYLYISSQINQLDKYYRFYQQI